MLPYLHNVLMSTLQWYDPKSFCGCISHSSLTLERTIPVALKEITDWNRLSFSISLRCDPCLNTQFDTIPTDQSALNRILDSRFLFLGSEPPLPQILNVSYWISMIIKQTCTIFTTCKKTFGINKCVSFNDGKGQSHPAKTKENTHVKATSTLLWRLQTLTYGY